jgi:Family of unknown function (DUF6491)
MNRKLILPAALLMVGCSSTSTQPQEIEAVRDFVAATELEEVNEIRLTETLSYTYVNDRYVTVPTRRGDYLVELRRDCFELRRNNFTPEMVDVRDNRNVLRARFDTIRGCYIGTIYEITEAQREELRNLGDAPGDEIYLPDVE